MFISLSVRSIWSPDHPGKIHTDHNQSVEWATRHQQEASWWGDSCWYDYSEMEEMIVNYLRSRAPRKILLHSVKMVMRKVVDQPKTKVKLQREQQPRNVGFRAFLCTKILPEISANQTYKFNRIWNDCFLRCILKWQKINKQTWEIENSWNKMENVLLTVLGFVLVVSLQIIITT